MKITSILIRQNEGDPEAREFVPIKNGTFAHDIWITSRVRTAGLSNIQLEDGESQDDFIERLAIAAWESGLMLELLGGLLMPANLAAKDWTPELAKQTSQFFGDVTDEESKKQLRRQIGGVLFYFFVNALSSSRTSTRSTVKTEKDEGERHATAGASITATGPM